MESLTKERIAELKSMSSIEMEPRGKGGQSVGFLLGPIVLKTEIGIEIKISGYRSQLRAIEKLYNMLDFYLKN